MPVIELKHNYPFGDVKIKGVSFSAVNRGFHQSIGLLGPKSVAFRKINENFRVFASLVFVEGL